MLELMHQEQTNSSIAWKIQVHNSYFVNLPKMGILKNWSWGLTIHSGQVLEFAGES
jgi:formylmethanofuran dehydrogenase subunit A